jgi:hypothetical protein
LASHETDLTEEVNQLVLENMEYEKKTKKCEKIQNEIKKKQHHRQREQWALLTLVYFC